MFKDFLFFFSELCQPSESASNNKSEDLKIDENASTTTSKPSSPDSDQRSVKDNSSDSNEKSSPTGQVISSRNFDSKISTSVVPSSKSAELPTVPGATPILRKVGEKTPPGTLTRNKSNSSCKSWYSQYSQAFLSKTIGRINILSCPFGFFLRNTLSPCKKKSQT